MADREYYIGTIGPYVIDDADPLNTDPGQVATKQEISDVVDVTAVNGMVKGNGSFLRAAVPGTDYQTPISGVTSSIVVVTNTSPVTTSTLNFTNGILTSIT